MAKVITIFKPPRITKKAAQWEKAYIAGVVDAKVGLAVYPHRVKGRARAKLFATLGFHSHYIKLLKMVQERYGGIIKFVDMSKEKGITTYRLDISRHENILLLMQDISEYLIAKNRQADLLRKYCQSRLEALKNVEHSSQAPITEKERSIVRELTRLNKLSLHPERSPL